MLTQSSHLSVPAMQHAYLHHVASYTEQLDKFETAAKKMSLKQKV